MAFPFPSEFINVMPAKVFEQQKPCAQAIVLVFLAFVAVLLPAKALAIGDPEKGRVVFTKNNCFACHPGGDNTLDPGHPIKGQAFLTKYKEDAVLEKAVRNGFLQSGMPGFSKTAISDRQMKDLIAFVRSLSNAPKSSK